MKRIQLIAAALCLVMLATAGAGVVAATGSPSNYKFDVTYNGKVVGQAIVNTAKAKEPTYSIVMQGLPAAKQYKFGYTISGVPQPLGVATGAKTGAIAQRGTIPADDVKDIQSAQFWVMERSPGDAVWAYLYGFDVFNSGAFVTKIACYWSTDNGNTWTESAHTSGFTGEKHVTLKALGVPDVALVKVHVIVVGGKDRTGSEKYYDYARGASAEGHGYDAYVIEGVTWNPTLLDDGQIVIW